MEREWETRGDRNLAPRCCPPSASLPRPLACSQPPHLPSSWAPGTLGSAHPWHPGPTGFTWLKFQPAVGEEAEADTLHFPISGNKSCGAIYCQVEKKPIAKPCVKKQQHLGALLPLGEKIPGNSGAGNKGPFLCLWRGFVERACGGFGIRRAREGIL